MKNKRARRFNRELKRLFIDELALHEGEVERAYRRLTRHVQNLPSYQLVHGWAAIPVERLRWVE